MNGKAHINISLDSAVLDWIDRLRGQYPRSTFINRILDQFCEKQTDVFDWTAESKKADRDIEKGCVHKFADSKKAVKWLRN